MSSERPVPRRGVLVTGGSRGVGAEVARAVVALADPSTEWASGAMLDFNGASYLR